MSQQRDILPYGRQSIEEQDIEAVCEVLRGSFLTTGPTVQRFENAIAERVEAQHVIAVSNGTAALHLLYHALGLGPGDTIIVPAITFLATANAAELLGCHVGFCDVDSDSGLMTAELLEEAFERFPDAHAVTAVHLNGQCCDMGVLKKVCQKHGALLLEDAAHALGSYNWSDNDPARPVGGCKDSTATCFSFHPVKTIAMGEGGAISTNDAELADKIRRLRNHGISTQPAPGSLPPSESQGRPNPWMYYMEEPGYNYRVTDIQCALGLSQLSRIDRFVAERQRLADRYDGAFEALGSRAKPVARVSPVKTGWHLYPLLCEGGAEEREDFFHFLIEQRIRPQVHYIPLTQQPYYSKRIGSATFPGAMRYYERVVSLPLFVGLTDDEQDRVIEAVKRFFAA